MSDQWTPTAAQRTTSAPPRSDYAAAPYEDTDAGMGWVRFAGVIMMVLGGFGVIEGLVALFTPTYFVTVNGAVLAVNLNSWGWVHIIVGALVLATGASLVGAAPSWARVVGIALVAVNMIVQLAWLPAYPIWSIIVLVLDVIVLYALIATWGQRADV